VRVVSEKKVFQNHTSLSHRKHGKYIAVNGAIPEGTIDSELLGMKRRFYRSDRNP
jgi:transcriptional regulator with PAS, ATPase and Fis domain